jgi:hypothetical protein
MRTTLLAATATLAFTAQAQLDLPQPSPLGKVEQVVGLTNVTIEYSRPSVKGRKILGDVVPYDKMWRTGANASTKVTFDNPVTVAGSKVPAGTYSLLTIPHEASWEVFLNSDSKVNGMDGYDASLNVVTTKADPAKGAFVETFTINITDVVKDAAVIELAWAEFRVRFSVEAPATEQGLANIDKALSATEIKAGTYGSAARFCIDRGVRTKEALAWAQKSVDMDAKYWTLHTLALAQAANGDKKAAITTAQRSMEMAKAENADAYVKLNEEKIGEWGK